MRIFQLHMGYTSVFALEKKQKDAEKVSALPLFLTFRI
jgi:hypothetical protein